MIALEIMMGAISLLKDRGNVLGIQKLQYSQLKWYLEASLFYYHT